MIRYSRNRKTAQSANIVKKKRSERSHLSSATSRTRCRLSLRQLEAHDGLLVRVEPPRDLIDADRDHVACNIVLVIDVSGSMSNDAPAAPNEAGQAKEHTGLTIFDLTKT